MRQATDIHEPLFRNWLPAWFITTALILCIIPSVMLLGLFNSNVAFASSFLDVEAEDLQFLFLITYGTLAATMLIENRFFHYFPTRNYMVLFICGNIVVLFITTQVHNYYLLTFLRFLQGVFMVVGPSAFLQLLFVRIKHRSARLIGYSVYYAALLMSGTFTLHLVTWALDRYGWQEMLYATMAIYIAVLFIVLLVFNPHRHLPRYPLYQIDFTGFLFLMVTLLSGSFVLVYGRKLYWFQSVHINIALVVFLFSSGLFIARQLTVKRPLYHFEVLKFGNFRIGILLFIVFYILRAGLNNVYATMYAVWHWEFAYIVQVQYINVAGIALAILTSSYLLYREVAIKYLLAIGFTVLAVQFAWFTLLFNSDCSIQQLAVPLFLQGFGTGFIFTPLVIFIVSSVPQHLASMASVSALASRFWATGIGFAIVQNAQYILQRKHYLWLQQYLTPDSYLWATRYDNTVNTFTAKGYPVVQAGQVAVKQLNAAVEAQSFLLSNMEIYTAMAAVALAVALLLMLNANITGVVATLKNRVWGVG